MDLVLENDDLAGEDFAAGSILCEETVEAICAEASIGTKSPKTLLLDDQLIDLRFIALQHFLVARHLLGSLSDALPLEARLLVDLADLHEDHRSREEIQLLVDQEARQVLQEQCLVVGSIE